MKVGEWPRGNLGQMFSPRARSRRSTPRRAGLGSFTTVTGRLILHMQQGTVESTTSSSMVLRYRHTWPDWLHCTMMNHSSLLQPVQREKAALCFLRGLSWHARTLSVSAERVPRTKPSGFPHTCVILQMTCPDDQTFWDDLIANKSTGAQKMFMYVYILARWSSKVIFCIFCCSTDYKFHYFVL